MQHATLTKSPSVCFQGLFRCCTKSLTSYYYVLAGLRPEFKRTNNNHKISQHISNAVCFQRLFGGAESVNAQFNYITWFKVSLWRHAHCHTCGRTGRNNITG